MRESEAHKSSGIIGYLKNPVTGEMMMLHFPPGVFELRLEMQLISRTATVYATIEHGEPDPEYDVRLRMDTRKPEGGLDAAAKELHAAAGALRQAVSRPQAPPLTSPHVSAFDAPRAPVDRSASVFAETNPQRPFAPVPQAPQAPQASQAPQAPQAPAIPGEGAPAGLPAGTEGSPSGPPVSGAGEAAPGAPAGAGEPAPSGQTPASPQATGKPGAKGAAKPKG